MPFTKEKLETICLFRYGYKTGCKTGNTKPAPKMTREFVLFRTPTDPFFGKATENGSRVFSRRESDVCGYD